MTFSKSSATVVAALLLLLLPRLAIADPPVPSSEEIVRLADRVAEWQLDHLPENVGEWENRGWIMGACYTGLLKYAAATHRDEYVEPIAEIAAVNGWRLGDRERHADDHVIGYVYGQLFKRIGTPAILAPTVERFDALGALPYDEPLEWKNSITYREWAWCDALFMAPPTMTLLSELTGEPSYAEQADRLWWKTADFLYDKDERLFYRDARFFDKQERNGRPVFWARGNGWVVAGLTRVLETLPESDPRRAKYVGLFTEMMGRLVELQSDTGYWPSGLLDPATWSQPESSGTAFFTYGLFWGINHGVLPQTEFLPPALRGWHALSEAVSAEGKVGWVQTVAAEPGSTGPEVTEPYATGGMLLAASEAYKFSLTQGAERAVVECGSELDVVRLHETIALQLAEVEARLGDVESDQLLVIDQTSGDVLLHQIQRGGFEGDTDKLILQVSLSGARPRRVAIYKTQSPPAAPTSRVYGRAVPERLDDFAWESDRIAYRLYGPALGPQNDADSGLDPWVKRVRYPVIDKWYAGGDYHTDHGEGLDGYKVGKSRGAGGLGVHVDGKLYTSGVYAAAELLDAGPVRVRFKLEYGPWDTPLGSVSEERLVSLDANHHLCRFESRFRVDGGSGVAPIAAGVQLRIEGTADSGSNWVGFWEQPSGPNGVTGVGLLMPGRSSKRVEHTQTRRSGRGDAAFEETNRESLLVTSVELDESLITHVGAGWSESGYFDSQDAWFEFLNRRVEELESPVKVKWVD